MCSRHDARDDSRPAAEQETSSAAMPDCGVTPIRGAWDVVHGDGPLVAVALHSGHALRPEVADLMSATDSDRLREEDPATSTFGIEVPTRITVHRSRFEVDLNRPRERAVYGDADDAWGIPPWRQLPLPDEVIERSLSIHDAFYAEMESLLTGVVHRHGGFVLLDLHSYNHRRGGPGAKPDDPAENPGVNLGTGSLDRERWAAVIETFVETVGEGLGPDADIRENVKFRGGYLSRWVHERYPTGCCLAVEFKKTYMDEWTGVTDPAAVTRISAAVAAACPRLETVLGEILSAHAIR